jgi:4-nitrophenyl phosphatase
MPVDLKTFDAVLLDLDGTIWHEEVALPGAIELIHTLQQRGQPFAFVSNSGLSPARLLARLGRMGAEVRVDQVYTAAKAGCDYVRQHFARGTRVFSVAGMAVEELLGDYVTFVAADHATVGEVDPGRADVVMSASLANPNATLERFQSATRHLIAGATLVALCADRSYPTPRGIEVGAGAVAAMLAYAANVTPVYCGKPQRIFFEELCQALNVRPDRCVLVGDNLEADVAGAKPLGIKTILPLTGVTTREHLEIELAHQPDWVVEDLSGLR